MGQVFEGRFDGKVALVTGGASGIGLGTATRLAAEGGRVVLADVNAAALDTAVADLGGDAVAVGALTDVTDEAAVAAAVAVAVERFGQLDIAVNAAGIGTVAPIQEHPVEEWDRVLDINLKGVFLAVKHESKAMLDAGRPGVILNIASLNARQPGEGMAAYCASKAAVSMLTQVAAMELGAHGIRVVAIGPGLVETPLTSFAKDVPQIHDAYVDNTPMGRAGTVDDIAAAICWMVSDEASWVSGDTFYVDGAAHTRQYPRFFRIFSELGAPPGA
jgi:NAD(P)-dependent dehydrogenase (short-subunit alcohol dehydrogenase family)